MVIPKGYYMNYDVKEEESWVGAYSRVMRMHYRDYSRHLDYND